MAFGYGDKNDERALVEAAARNNFKMPDIPFDPMRLLRAEKFANQIVAIIKVHMERPQWSAAQEALVAAGYISDAAIQTEEDRVR